MRKDIRGHAYSSNEVHLKTFFRNYLTLIEIYRISEYPSVVVIVIGYLEFQTNCSLQIFKHFALKSKRLHTILFRQLHCFFPILVFIYYMEFDFIYVGYLHELLFFTKRKGSQFFLSAFTGL